MTHQDREHLDALRQDITGGSLHFRSWGAFRSFDQEETEVAADALQAEPDPIFAKKQLIRPSFPAWASINAHRSQLRKWWYQATMPYVVDGVRLIRRKSVEKITQAVEKASAQLAVMAGELDAQRDTIAQEGKARLGRLWRDDYLPPTFKNQFSVEFRERSIEPPSYLAHSNSEEYQRQLARTLDDIRQSQRMLEQQMWRQLFALVSKLETSLAPDGKVYASHLQNIHNLFDNLAELNFEGTALFQNCIASAKETLADVSADDLRSSRGLRAEILEDVKSLAKNCAAQVQAMTAEAAPLQTSAA